MQIWIALRHNYSNLRPYFLNSTAPAVETATPRRVISDRTAQL